MKKKIYTALLLIMPLIVSAQIVKHERLLSFEETQVPSYATGEKSSLAASSNHYKDGMHSLEWNYSPGGEVIIKKDLHFEKKDPTGKDTYLSTFVVWIYNEIPVDESIRFEFLKDGKKCTSFPFNINFKGWRAAWVCYERDMEGVPEEGMNEIRIVAPNQSGKLYIDHLITATKTDHRYQTADIQVPFVNKNSDNHWLYILKASQLRADIVAQPISDVQKNEIKEIEKRLYNLIYIPSQLSGKEIDAIRKDFDWYTIKYENGQISGVPLFFGRAVEAYERMIPDYRDLLEKQGVELRKYFTLMNRIAITYNNATESKDRDELGKMFIAMHDHAQDQGVAYGSCLGNITHYGYSFRNYFTAYFLMKDHLAKTGRLEDAEKTMQWYAMTNEVFVKPTQTGMDMDAFNTLTTGRIGSILMMKDSPEKIQYLKSFSRWINNGCLPAVGLLDAFKTDGSAYHHCNNYPAYAVGGLTGAANMIYLLSRTSFSISETGHQTVKNVLQTMRFYCNKTHFPLSMSGRHPDGRGELIPIQYARMAMAGTPDGSSAIDKEMGAAYLRLKTKEDTSVPKPEYMPVSQGKEDQILIDNLRKNGIEPEEEPTGNLSLAYGCTSVQRRGNWSAVVRGHSRYLWAAEHYLGANLYGRYLAHGSMQIMTAADNATTTPTTSGWQEEGFDWGRIPGTTAIHLPVDQLKANVLNVDVHSGFEEMLYSDEAFAGGITQQHSNGAFGMKLHEHDKYNGSHRARKSYHFFDGRIVCLGSDIENINNNYDTETTVFQIAVANDAEQQYWTNYAGDTNYWLDHLGTGYYVPSKKENLLKFEKNFPQLSRKQNTGIETSGNWVSLVVDHGKAPKGRSYEYVVIPKTSKDAIKSFAMKPTYKVLQQNKNAHVVKDLQTNTTSYILFETSNELPQGLLLSVDTPCLVMTKEKNAGLILTVCNPDLALYEGKSDEAFDENGKRVERSIYSRPWIENESKETPITITLKGMWKTKDTPYCKVISASKKETVIQFICKNGASFDVELN